MSCTAQAVEDALQHVLFHIQGLLDLSEGHQVPGVEELDTHSLERRDLKVVRLRSGCACARKELLDQPAFHRKRDSAAGHDLPV
eukprot:2177106-Prorocentrum_lima.AAC.2